MNPFRSWECRRAWRACPSPGIADIPGFDGPQGAMLGLADCAITAQPDAKDLAGIAISSADTVSKLLGWDPRVAMLAFSTCGSSEHESLEVIREAIGIVRESRRISRSTGSSSWIPRSSRRWQNGK